ncbi:hypothetical protein KI427_26750 (plasmid) [Rhodococcus ruber]|nr:hypothetical protein KXC42_25075 [Rhodococcus sp. LW-XY12]UQB75903.1 hypothetical protein KI427_26750 [Rhodococcus ruber]
MFGSLYVSESGARNDDRAAAADREHAEQLAEDYAVGAATVDFQDLDAWLGRLKEGTSDELAARFEATSPPLREILLPLQWKSTASPIAATVETEADGVYTVNAFVDVDSTSVQNPDSAQSTVTYSVTIDRNAGWEITDVGGLDGAIPGR